MHVNKVHHVTTITRVAADLGEDEGWLWDVAGEMEIEDGLIWVYGIGEDGIPAFTDFGIARDSRRASLIVGSLAAIIDAIAQIGLTPAK